MTNDALPTYLQDHLAGALHAIELLKSMRDHYAGEPLGTFAAEVLAQVEADRVVLARIVRNRLVPDRGPVFLIALATQPFLAAVGRIKEPWPSLSLFRASFDRVVDHQHQDRANHGYD